VEAEGGKQRRGSRGGSGAEKAGESKRRRGEGEARRGRTKPQTRKPRTSHLEVLPRLAVRTSTKPVARPCPLVAILTQPPPRTEGWLAFMGPPLPFQAFALGPGFLQRSGRQLRQLFPSTAHWPGALARTHDPAHFTKLRALSTQDDLSHTGRTVESGAKRAARANPRLTPTFFYLYLSYSAPSPFPPASLLPKPALAFAHVLIHVLIHVLG